MLVGHFAVAMAAEGTGRRISLGLRFAAAQWLDLLWPILLVTGIERVRIVPGITAFNALDFVSYPWSHSLLMSLAWGAAGGVASARLLRSASAGLDRPACLLGTRRLPGRAVVGPAQEPSAAEPDGHRRGGSGRLAVSAVGLVDRASSRATRRLIS